MISRSKRDGGLIIKGTGSPISHNNICARLIKISYPSSLISYCIFVTVAAFHSSYGMATTLYQATTDTDDSDLSSVTSPPFSSASSVSSYTSYDVSMRSASPAPSVWSVTNSIRANAYKQEFGRDLNNYSEVYRLPADAEEMSEEG
jgi:hypothetical protein